MTLEYKLVEKRVPPSRTGRNPGTPMYRVLVKEFLTSPMREALVVFGEKRTVSARSSGIHKAIVYLGLQKEISVHIRGQQIYLMKLNG